MTTRQRKCRRTKKGIDINLSDIKYDSTCMSLNIPLVMSCDICKPKIEAMCGMSKKSSREPKRFRDLSDRWKCQQLWLSRHAEDKRSKTTVQKHFRVRNYLNIAQEVVLDCESLAESKHNSINVVNNLSTATEKMQARKRASKMLTTKCNSDLPLKRKKKRRKKLHLINRYPHQRDSRHKTY